MTQRCRWIGQTSESHDSMQASLYVLKHILNEVDHSFSSRPLPFLPSNLLTANCTLLVCSCRPYIHCWSFPGIYTRSVQAPFQTLEVTRSPQKFCNSEGGKGSVRKETRMTFSWSLLSWANALFEWVYSVKSFPYSLSLCCLCIWQTRLKYSFLFKFWKNLINSYSHVMPKLRKRS